MVLGSTGKDSIWKHYISPLSGLNNYWNRGRANQVERNTGIKGNKENKYPKGRVKGPQFFVFFNGNRSQTKYSSYVGWVRLSAHSTTST